MKTIKSSMSVALMSLVLFSFMFVTSCSKSGESTPATELAATVDNITADIAKVQSLEEFEASVKKYEADLKKYDGSDYKMTDSDKDVLVESIVGFTKVLLEKSAELQGQDSAAIEPEMLDMMSKELRRKIDSCVTISDIANIR